LQARRLRVPEIDIPKKIDFLFKTHTKPDGKEYTYQEVERESGKAISAAYVWKLRHGKSSNPSGRKLKALADFFDVPLRYFYEEVDEDYHEILEIVHSLRQAGVQEIALRAKELNEEGRKAILSMVEHIRSMQTGKESTDETS